MKILGGKLKGKNFYMPAGISPTQNLLRKAVFDILGDISGADFLELFAGSGAVGLEAFSRGAKTVTLVEREPRCVEIIHENLKLLGITHHPGNYGCHCERNEGLRLRSGQVLSLSKDEVERSPSTKAQDSERKSNHNLFNFKEIASSPAAFLQNARGGVLAMTQTTTNQLTVIPADAFVAIKQLAKNNKKYDIVFLDPPFGLGLGKKALKALGAYDILHPNCFLLIQVEKNEILPNQEGRFYLIKEKKYGISHLFVYEGICC